MLSSTKCSQIIYLFDECKNIYYGGIRLKKDTTKRVAKSEIMKFFNLNDDIEENYAIVYVKSFKGAFQDFSSSIEMTGHYSYCQSKIILQTVSIQPDTVVKGHLIEDNIGYIDTSYGHGRVDINTHLLHQPEMFSSTSSIMIGTSSEELSIQPVPTPLISEINLILPDTEKNTNLSESTIIPPEIEKRYKTFYKEINADDLAAGTTGEVYNNIYFIFFSTIRLINMEYLGILSNARQRQFSKNFR
jgi:hypothetical protein